MNLILQSLKSKTVRFNIALYTTVSGAAWTGSGTKSVVGGFITYHLA